MKKLFSTILVVAGFSFLMAQTPDVPTGVKVAFKNAYKSTTVEWTTTSQYYVAKWVTSEKNMTAYYAKVNEASLVRTETEVPLTQLSTSAQNSANTFLTNGSQYTLNRAFKVENMAEVAEGIEFNMSTGGKISVFYNAGGTMTKREISQ